VDMFTGVGPFALHIGNRKQATVFAIDINPDAIRLLEASMKLNRLVGTVIPVVADAREYAKSFEPRSADHVLMNHPSGAGSFVSSACTMLRPGGTLHYYCFSGGESPEGSATQELTSLVSAAGRTVKEIQVVRRVRDSAPYEYQVVVDAIID
jgi:tRNA G37 N-methylase Trm5